MQCGSATVQCAIAQISDEGRIVSEVGPRSEPNDPDIATRGDLPPVLNVLFVGPTVEAIGVDPKFFSSDARSSSSDCQFFSFDTTDVPPPTQFFSSDTCSSSDTADVFLPRYSSSSKGTGKHAELTEENVQRGQRRSRRSRTDNDSSQGSLMAYALHSEKFANLEVGGSSSVPCSSCVCSLLHSISGCSWTNVQTGNGIVCWYDLPDMSLSWMRQ